MVDHMILTVSEIKRSLARDRPEEGPLLDAEPWMLLEEGSPCA
jgi:hypothetical protein